MTARMKYGILLWYRVTGVMCQITSCWITHSGRDATFALYLTAVAVVCAYVNALIVCGEVVDG